MRHHASFHPGANMTPVYARENALVHSWLNIPSRAQCCCCCCYLFSNYLTAKIESVVTGQAPFNSGVNEYLRNKSSLRVVFTLNRYFAPKISVHEVRALILRPTEIPGTVCVKVTKHPSRSNYFMCSMPVPEAGLRRNISVVYAVQQDG